MKSLVLAKKGVANRSKPGNAEIDGIISGVQGMTTEGNHYSFAITDTYKTHSYLKNQQYLVLYQGFHESWA